MDQNNNQVVSQSKLKIYLVNGLAAVFFIAWIIDIVSITDLIHGEIAIFHQGREGGLGYLFIFVVLAPLAFILPILGFAIKKCGRHVL